VVDAAAAAPTRLAVISPDSAKITFAELDQQGRSVAGWVAQNSARGDRVAIVADNS
jgi:acyl-CoA synthetase (AMP-forming)/AMP-acid ligase II